MKAFMDNNFLLETETARHLFHDYAEQLPLVDYHCHISPREIYENRRFRNLAEVWLGGKNPDGTYFGDHYKWRLMRSHGIDEEYITGSAPDEERIVKFAEALEMAIGNPMYHWTNLELHQFFGIANLCHGYNCKAAQVAVHEKGLGIGVGNDAQADMAREPADVVLELGPERGVLDVVDRPLEALRAAQRHATAVRTQMRMVIRTEEQVAHAVLFRDDSAETAHLSPSA